MTHNPEREHLKSGAQASGPTEKAGEALLELYQKAPDLTDTDLYEFALDHAVHLTSSEIGFFHLVSDDQKEVVLTTWNRAALSDCTAVYDAHYPIEQAGNWVDCVRFKRPVVYNDFPGSPNQKGLPEGHVPLRRFMSAPVAEHGKVKIIFGVANKPEDYDDDDVIQLQLVASELLKIIKQRRSEQELHRLNRDLRALSNCNQALIRAEDEQTLLDEICHIICEDAGYSAAWVGYAQADDAKTVRPAAWAGVEDEYLSTVDITWADTEHGRGPTGTAIRTGRTDCVRDVETSPRMGPWHEATKQRGYRSIIGLPLKGKGPHPFGALTICSSDGDAFPQAEIRLLEELAGDLAFGISALRTVIRRREAEASFAAVFHGTPDLIALIRLADGTVVEVNDGCTQVLGYSAEEVIGKTTGELAIWMNPDDRAIFIATLRATGSVSKFESDLRRKDGKSIAVIQSARTLDFKGEHCALWVAHDITDRKRAEESLARLAAVVTSSHDAIFTKDLDGIVTSWNVGAEEVFGYTADETVGRSVATFMPADRKHEPEELIERVKHGERIVDFESERVDKDGHLVQVSVSLSPLHDAAGTLTAISVIGRDITERKRAEQALREERGLFVGGPTVVFKWRAQEDWPVEYVSPNVTDEFGYTPEDLIGGEVPYASIVHPDDLERVGAEVSSFSEQGASSFEQVYRIKRPDGCYRWIDDFTTVVRGRDGTITHYLGYVLDITERKEAEEELARSRELLQSVMDFSPSLIYLVDVDGRFLLVNAGLADFLQTPPDELIGRDRSQVLSVEAARQHRANDLEVLMNGQAEIFTEEIAVSGETHYYQSVKFPVLDASGEVCAIGGISTDATERRKTELELVRMNRALEEAVTRLNEAQRIAHLGSWELDIVNDTLVWSEEIYHMFEIDPAEFGASYQAFLETIHPEDREAVNLAYTTSLETRAPYAIDHRLLFPDGRVKYVHEECETKYDEDRPIRSLGTVQDVTERKLAEEAVRESQQRYRDIFDHSTDTLYLLEVTDDGRFKNLEVNPTFEASTGLSRDQIIGKYQEETVPQAQADIVNAKYRRCVEAGAPIEEEAELELPSGRHIYHSTLIPLRDDSGCIGRILGISRDITASRLAEEALRASQAKLALHLEQTLLGVIEWDSDFRCQEWNPAAEAIFGYSREEALGHLAAELIVPKEALPQVESVWHQLLQEEGGQFNTNANVTKDGRAILCEWVNTPLVDDNGTVVGVMTLARDITERQRTEELRIAKEAAEAASIAKSTFLANMSHEIRTPMNAILGFSQLLRHGEGLSERQRQQLDTINSSGEYLLALINDVLEMSKVEAGKISANRTAFDLHSLLDEMDSLFSQRAEVKGLDLRVIRSDKLPRFVVADENKLRQVLVNLLGNAVKFTSEGFVELRVTIQRDTDGRVRLLGEIEDTGLGIAPEDIGRLFQYFEQAESARRSEAGTGLGLAISREFVRLLGGDITVSSTLGVGSVFKFDIFIAEAESGEVTSAADQRHVVSLRPEEPRYRVLVADDAPDNRELLVQMLEPIGFNVRTVSDGKEALEVYEAWHPRLILMDMRMPVMDGYEATRRIRATPNGTEVAVIGVTASAFAEMRQGVFDAGVDEFIVKPFHEGELFGKIGKLLDARYIYEEDAAETAQKATELLDAAALAALPGNLVARLREAASNAAFDTVLELADEIEQHDGRSAAALRTLAERFDSERILDTLPESEDS